MRAPIGYHAITTVGTIPFSTVPDDLVIRDTASYGPFIHRDDETACRRKSVDAVWHSVQVKSALGFGGDGCHLLAGFNQLVRQMNQTRPNLSNPVRGEFATTVWSRKENRSIDIRPMLEDERACEQLLIFRRQRRFSR